MPNFPHTAALDKAEQAGLKLAIKGRIVAAVLFFVFYAAIATSRSVLLGLDALTMLMALGFLHYWLIASGREHRWHRFALVGVDVSVISAVAIFAPLGTLGDIPQISYSRFTRSAI